MEFEDDFFAEEECGADRSGYRSELLCCVTSNPISLDPEYTEGNTICALGLPFRTWYRGKHNFQYNI